MSEQSRGKHVYAFNLPNWINEVVESEAKVTHRGNVSHYLSDMIETLFTVQRKVKK